MFTGLVQDIGRVESVEGGADGARLRIATKLGAEIGLGDSIAVNGVCLTATEADARGFATEAMNQTLEVTVIGALAPGARVNLELATRADERLGGHIVQGHADGSGAGHRRSPRTASPAASGSSSHPSCCATSSTRARSPSTASASRSPTLGATWVEVSLIPETLERTNLGDAAPGDPLNVEVDVVAKYVERLLSPFAGKDKREPGDRHHQGDRHRRHRRDPRRRAGRGSPFATIEEAIEEIRRGKMVVVCDGEDRENEGDLVMAAQFATPEAVNFMAKEARGLICLALTPERCRKLGLNLMAAKNEAPLQTAFTVSIEAAGGVSTGISAHDRAHTIQVAIDPTRARATSSSPATCSRCRRKRAACWSAPATPRRASTSPASPG